MKRKFLLAAVITVAAITLVVATVLTTMAYLTASTAVSNTFTVGKVSIEMYESPVDANGKKTPGEKKTSLGNNYHLVPGKSYDKDPSVYVLPNSEPCYLFIKIRNQISSIEESHIAENPTMEAQMTAKGWTKIGTTASGNIYAYEGGTPVADDGIVASQIVPSSTQTLEYPVFDKFTVEHDISTDDLVKVAGSKVTLTAYAIQTDGFTTKDESDNEQIGLNNDVIDAWNSICDTITYETAYLNYDGTEKTSN